MITLSLNEIRKHSPCKQGWEKLLKSKQNTHWEEQFPLSDIIDSNGIDDALWCLRARPEHSKLWRKYAVWCARQVEHLMTDNRSKSALDVAWRHSEGVATDQELAAAVAAAALAAEWAASWLAARNAARAAWDAAAGAARDAARAAAGAAAADSIAAAAAAAWDAAEAAQEKKLREILQTGEWSDGRCCRN